VYWEPDQESAAVVVRFKLRRWRAIASHRFEDFRHTSGASLCQIQLFQEFTNATVSVAATDCATSLKVGQSY
jgi:hypothetical protein